jgi:hypothetical protein
MSRSRSSPAARRGWSIAFATFGALLALLGGALLYARENVFDHDTLASRAETALRDERVRLAVAQPITDAILDEGPPTLVNARPLIESVTTGALNTPPVRAAFGEAVKALAARLFDRDPDTLLLNLASAASLAGQTLEAVDPKLARKLPARISDVRIEVTASIGPIDSLQLADDVRVAGIVLLPVALLLLLGSVAVAPDRRAGIVRASLAVAIAAIAGVIALAIGKSVLVASFDDDLVADAAGAVWDALLADLRRALMFGGALALVLAAAARFTENEEFDPLAPFIRAGELLRRRPGGVALGLLRALALGAIGVALILVPTLSLQAIAVVAGAWVLYVGVGELLAIVAPPVPAGEERRSRVRPARIATAVASIAAVTLAVALLAGGGSADERPSGPPPACNGYPQLCHKRIDQVTFPATHNSMSAAQLGGWFLTNQRFAIPRQLDDGIRGLLIDTHYGIQRGNGRGLGEVITDFDKENKTRQEVAAEIGEDGVRAAEDLVGKIAFNGAPGESKPYLCHVLCELGATPLEDGLGEIADWMRTHPDEFLVIFVEDVVSPEETAAAFEKSGLLRWAWVPDPDVQPPPTMGQLIEQDHRLLVLAENDNGGGKYPWYQQGFDLFQETPYTFNSVPQIESPQSCQPNRGSTSNPLFLMNSWIERIPRDPSLAARIDSRDALLRRVKTCQRIRGLTPNLIAVDYYDQGDVLAVANILNGIPPDEPPSVRTTR